MYACGTSLLLVPSRQLGQDVGDVILNTGPAQTGRLMTRLEQDEEVLGNPRLNEAVLRANAHAQRVLVPGDLICARNWSSSCPAGWDVVGPSCSAPAGYRGACPSAQVLAATTLMERYKFAERCDAPWPCVAETGVCLHGRDYDVCPKGWADVGSGYCQSILKLVRCANFYRFSSMSVRKKQELVAACGLEWPCKDVCERDYEALCPASWQPVEDLCVAPASYSGPCGFSFNTTSLSHVQKRSLAEKCGVLFPCLGLKQSRNKMPSPPVAGALENGPVTESGSVARPTEGSGQMLPLVVRLRSLVSDGAIDGAGDIHP